MPRMTRILALAGVIFTIAPATAGAYPSLETIAYRFWGARLESACPNGNLKFTVTHIPPAGATDARGASWHDCHPWVMRDSWWPLECATAMHETGHEVGLLDTPGTGGLMDNTRLIIGSRGWIHYRHRTVYREIWTGVPAVCEPGHFNGKG